MWRTYLGDTLDGAVAQPIDVPGLSWTVSVSDASLHVGRDRDKGVGEESGSGINIPVSAIPGRNAAERNAAVMPYKRALLLAWEDARGNLSPVVWGAIGPRTDTEAEVQFDLLSPMALLGSRYLVREGAFGAVAGRTEVTEQPAWDAGKKGGYPEGSKVSHAGHDWESTADGNTAEPGTPGAPWADLGESPRPQAATFTRDEVALSGLSWRGIVSEVGRLCTDAKPAGRLPIDWSYVGERGTRSLSVAGFDVGNASCADLIESVANSEGGPDVQLRPYMADASHVRLRLVAGSDADVFLPQGATHAFEYCRGRGGTAEDVRVDWAGPVMRVYATGAGTDEAQLCHLAEDLSLCRSHDPWPLVEEHYNDPDAESGEALAGSSGEELAAVSRPQVQVAFEYHADDPGVPAPGSIWPGEVVRLHSEGHPTLPDGDYDMRLMEMSGDDTSKVRLTFRQMEAPTW